MNATTTGTKIQLDGSVRPWESQYDPHLLKFDLDENEFRLVSDILARSVAERGEEKAFSLVLPTGDFQELTYTELDEASDALAAYLVGDLGLMRGDVVAVQLPNSLHFPVIFFAAMKAGLTITNLNPLYSEREVIHQIRDSGAKMLFGFALFAERLTGKVQTLDLKQIIIASPWEFFPTEKAEMLKSFLTEMKMVPAIDFPHATFDEVMEKGRAAGPAKVDLSAVQPGDAALIQYTGGTTGVSKGAVLTHTNLTSVLHMVYEYGIRHSDEEIPDFALAALPLYHIFAMILNLMMFVRVGRCSVLIPNPQPLTNLKPAFEHYDIDWMTGVDTLYAGLLAEDWFIELVPKVRYSIAGGSALRLSTAKRWEEKIGPIFEGYGLTETSCIIAFNPVDGSGRLGTVGLPMPGIDLRIVDEEGDPVGFEEPGHLLVRGANITTGYLNRPDETAKAFHDGWMETGDIVEMSEDGYLKIVDRKKDVIMVSGFNVFPNEIEDVIAALVGIGDVAAIGIPHEKRGEAPKIFAVRHDPHISEDDIIAHCREHLVAYKIPAAVEFVDELPKSPVGKILRKELRDKYVKAG